MTQAKRRLGLAVSLALYENIRELANDRGKTINSTCIDIFWEYFEKRVEKKQEEMEPGEVAL